jgi:hypothetical protein
MFSKTPCAGSMKNPEPYQTGFGVELPVLGRLRAARVSLRTLSRYGGGGYGAELAA